MVLIRSQKYGAKIRKLVDGALRAKKALYECRTCRKTKVKRKGFSIWQCKSCDACYAGGAYTLATEAGIISNRLVGEYQNM